jgi:hypothetical protein
MVSSIWRAMVFAMVVVAAEQTASAQANNELSSISSRLKSAEHISLQMDEKLSGYIIRVYSPEGLAKRIEVTKQYQIDYAKWQELRVSLEKRLKEAEKIKDPQERDRISSAIIKEFSVEPHRIYVTALHRVISVGGDYLEVDSHGNAESTAIIPFHKIVKIIVEKPAAR